MTTEKILSADEAHVIWLKAPETVRVVDPKNYNLES